jgi:chemotaxis protein MotA
MNFSTILGIIASLAVFITALAMSAKNWSVFIDPHAILIVIGGSAAASLLSFPLPKVIGLFKVFVRRMLGKNSRNYQILIGEIADLSEANRFGKEAYEETLKKTKDFFLKDAGEMLFWAEAEVGPDELREVLELRAETHYERYSDEADIFRAMSKFPPAFGLMGTTLGMIALLQSLGGADAKTTIGPSMSIALVATLYGIVMANFVFLPIAENLSKQSKEDLVARRMVIEGIMAIHAEMPTAFVAEKVKSFLLPSERQSMPKPNKSTNNDERKAA